MTCFETYKTEAKISPPAPHEGHFFGFDFALFVMIVILTRSLCLVGRCGSFRWVRGFCLLATRNVRVISCLGSVFVALELSRTCSPTWRPWVTVQVRGNGKVCGHFYLWFCVGVFVWWKEKESPLGAFWFRVLLAVFLHSSLGILELYTDNCKVLSNPIQTHVWSHLRQFCTGVQPSSQIIAQ